MSRPLGCETLRALEAQGLAVGRGYEVRIRVLDARQLEESFEVRAAPVGHAAESVALTQGAGLLLRARDCGVGQLVRQSAEVTRDRGQEAGAEANRLFHAALVALAVKSQIDRLLEIAWEQIVMSTRAGLMVEPRVEAAGHEEALNAIREGRAKRRVRWCPSYLSVHTRRPEGRASRREGIYER